MAGPRINVQFTPSGLVLDRFLRSHQSHRFLFGPLGSGKTFTCAFEMLRRACEMPPCKDGVRRSRGLITRTTGVDLATTAKKDWLELMDGEQHFRGQLGHMTGGPPPTYYLRFKLPDGTTVESEIYFMGLDDPDGINKIRGLNISFAWINEVREFPRDIIKMIFGRCGRYPRKEDVPEYWRGVWGDTNMPDTDHYLYNFAEEDTPEGWAFFRQPGGVIKRGGRWAPNPEAENLAFLPDGYYEQQVSGAKEDWVKVYLAAEYGFAMDGKSVYPEYSDAIHCVDFDIVRSLPLRVGMDFGLTPAAVFAQRGVAGQWRWHSELVTENTGIYRFAEMVKAHINEHYKGLKVAHFTGDPAGDARSPTDQKERTTFEILIAQGIPAAPAISNDFTKRREAVARPLSRLIDGEPGLIIHPHCKVARKGMAGGYAFRRMRVPGGDRYEDKPIKNMFSHVCEAGQYLHLGGGEYNEVIKTQQQSTVRINVYEPRDRSMGY